MAIQQGEGPKASVGRTNARFMSFQILQECHLLLNARPGRPSEEVQGLSSSAFEGHAHALGPASRPAAETSRSRISPSSLFSPVERPNAATLLHSTNHWDVPARLQTLWHRHLHRLRPVKIGRNKNHMKCDVTTANHSRTAMKYMKVVDWIKAR